MTDSKTKLSRCPACDAREIYCREVAANGAYGPFLLQGLGGFLKPAKMKVLLCAECGHLSFIADEEARRRVRSSSKWRRLR